MTTPEGLFPPSVPKNLLNQPCIDHTLSKMKIILCYQDVQVMEEMSIFVDRSLCIHTRMILAREVELLIAWHFLDFIQILIVVHSNPHLLFHERLPIRFSVYNISNCG